MCKENYDYFVEHKDEICAKNKNKFLAIKECKIIGVYDDFDEAFTKTSETEELGTFLIQFCSNDENTAVNHFYSNNIVFA